MHHALLTAAALSVATIFGVSAPVQVSFAEDDKKKASPETETQAPQFSDERLKAFAVASTMILEIRQKYLPKVQSAGNEEEARKIATTAQNEMLHALSANGLTVEQYNAVVVAARQDKSLVERIRNLEKSTESKK